jgi:tetratricopeptide (TPR) repeat protein
VSQEPSVEFVASLRAALAFWQPRLDVEPAPRLDPERHNLFRAVQFGLALPATRARAAEVVAAAFPFVRARGYWREWLPLLEQARAVGDELPPAAHIRLLNRLGFLRRLNRKLDDALIAHREALAVARCSGDPVQLAWTHAYLGRALCEARHYADAEEHLHAASQRVEGMDGERVERLIAFVHHWLGVVTYHLGRLPEAQDRLERALALRRQFGRPLLLSETLHDLANVHRAAGAYEEALTCYEEALSQLEGTGYRLERMMIHHSVGALHFSRKAYFLAEAAFRAIDFPFLRETGNVHMQAMVLVSLGNSLLYQEQYREAAATLRDSVSLWRQLQDDLELANAIGSVGEALAALGNHAEAAAAFDEALALLAQFPTDARAGRLRTLFTAELEKVAGQTAP